MVIRSWAIARVASAKLPAPPIAPFLIVIILVIECAPLVATRHVPSNAPVLMNGHNVHDGRDGHDGVFPIVIKVCSV